MNNETRKSAGPNWSRITAEGAVIVVSILLAFAIDAWWDGRREARNEQIALIDLRNELSENRSAISSVWLRFHLQSFLGAARLLHAIHGIETDLDRFASNDDSSIKGSFGNFYRSEIVGPLASQSLVAGDVTVALQLVRRTLSVPTYGPSISSLDVLFQSGSLANLADRELRARLTELPAELADLSDEELFLRDFVFGELRDALDPSAKAVMRAELIAPGRWMTEPSSAPGDPVTSIRVTGALAAALSTRLDLHRNVIMELAELDDQLGEIIEMMRPAD